MGGFSRSTAGSQLVGRLIKTGIRCEASAGPEVVITCLLIGFVTRLTCVWFTGGRRLVAKTLEKFCPYHIALRLSTANDKSNKYWSAFCCNEGRYHPASELQQWGLRKQRRHNCGLMKLDVRLSNYKSRSRDVRKRGLFSPGLHPYKTSFSWPTFCCYPTSSYVIALTRAQGRVRR
jgi:hypothetical protein